MLIVLLSACAHMSASWEITPDAQVEMSAPQLSIVADDRRCRPIADALTQELQRRRDVRVAPNSRVRLALSRCDVEVSTEVDIAQLFPGMGSGLTGGTEHREELIRSVGSVALTVEVDGRPQTTLGAKSHRVRRVQDGQRALGRLSLSDGVSRDLASQLAQQVVPEPEVVRRRFYRDPEPGSARALHNQAVDAERTGDLKRALELARKAAGASPTRVHQEYLSELEARVMDSRYVER